MNPRPKFCLGGWGWGAARVEESSLHVPQLVVPPPGHPVPRPGQEGGGEAPRIPSSFHSLVRIEHLLYMEPRPGALGFSDKTFAFLVGGWGPIV